MTADAQSRSADSGRRTRRGGAAARRDGEARGVGRGGPGKQRAGATQSPLLSAASFRSLQRLSLGSGACVGERFAPRLGSSAGVRCGLGGGGRGAARAEGGGVLRGGTRGRGCCLLRARQLCVTAKVYSSTSLCLSDLLSSAFPSIFSQHHTEKIGNGDD